MKKENQRNGTRAFLSGLFAFFITSTVTVTAAVLIFDLVKEKTDGSTVYAALTMAGCILVITAIFTTIDVVRRKIMIDKPLKQILDGTEKISGGDFSVRFTPIHNFGKYDEYDMIMDDLNKVATELSKIEILRNDFISNVSHEIKTPLAVIQNYASALQNDLLSKEERGQYVSTIISAAQRLNALVANILKLNKLENQVIFADNETVRLSDSLADAVLDFENRLEDKEIELECDLDENIVMVSDKSFLEIIWNNLLSNAVKFTSKNGKIVVSLKKDGKYAVVKVKDSGEGMTKETGEHIFEKFYQGDTSHSQEGNGLGLVLVKRVIDLIGGEISVESILGEGSTFTMKFRIEE